MFDLWQQIRHKLERRGRLQWAEEEFLQLEKANYYDKDPYDEALQSNLMQKSNLREKVFLLRLYTWRREVAEYKNYSKEMILPSKMIGHIVKGMRSGKKALRENRRLEGYAEAEHVWQSSSASDDSEPKLGMMPLV